MFKKTRIINQEKFSPDLDSKTDDLFFDSFGKFTSLSDQEKSMIFIKNNNNKFSISERKTKNPHVIKVPSINPGNLSFLENIYRESLYVVEDLRDDGKTIDDYLTTGIRRSFYYSEFYKPMSYEELNDAYEAFNSEIVGDETSVEFYYHKDNEEYYKASEDAPSELSLPNYYNDIAIPYDTGNQFLENPEDYITQKLAFLKNNPDQKDKTKTLLIPPENYNKRINFTRCNSFLNPSIKTDWLKSHDPVIMDEVNAFQEIPFYAKIKINKKLSVPKNKFVLNNLMFFDSNKRPKSGKFDLGTMLMRWHATQKQKINKNFKFYLVNETKRNYGELSPASYYSYELIDWVLRFTPSIVGEFGPKLSEIGGETPSSDLSKVTRTKLISVLTALMKFSDAFTGVESLQEESTEGLFSNVYENLPDFKSVLTNPNPIDNETLFYKIDKFEASAILSDRGLGDRMEDFDKVQINNAQPIQTFVIPNISETEIFYENQNLKNKKSTNFIEFIDTQIKYGKEYIYVVSEVKAILGFEYEYLKGKSQGNKTELTVRQYPKIRVVEVPMYLQRGSIVAPPPLPPEFEIIPIRRVQNKFRLFLKSTYGLKKETANYISTDSLDGFGKILANNFKQFGREKLVKFEDSTPVKEFRIYYSLKKPITMSGLDKFLGETSDNIRKYENFFDNLFATIPVSIGDSTAIDLSLEPNLKYYFCFVSVNKYNLFSNPTPIYELEIVNEGGLSYLNFKPYFPETDEGLTFYKNSLKVHRMFNIRPTSKQTEINLSKTFDSSQSLLNSKSKMVPVSIGTRMDSVFPSASPSNKAKQEGKKFKFRLKSTKSNKIIDLNVTYAHERVVSNYDLEPEKKVDHVTDNSLVYGSQDKLDNSILVDKQIGKLEIKPVPIIFEYE